MSHPVSVQDLFAAPNDTHFTAVAFKRRTSCVLLLPVGCATIRNLPTQTLICRSQNWIFLLMSQF
uniref:Uncharacterized protein n=1 Tax=Anguilla anguilla TaxID=7936 RepID=A0A0E9RZG4_ANGAN